MQEKATQPLGRQSTGRRLHDVGEVIGPRRSNAAAVNGEGWRLQRGPRLLGSLGLANPEPGGAIRCCKSQGPLFSKKAGAKNRGHCRMSIVIYLLLQTYGSKQCELQRVGAPTRPPDVQRCRCLHAPPDRSNNCRFQLLLPLTDSTFDFTRRLCGAVQLGNCGPARTAQ